jgi:hypothetical protein
LLGTNGDQIVELAVSAASSEDGALTPEQQVTLRNAIHELNDVLFLKGKAIGAHDGI